MEFLFSKDVREIIAKLRAEGRLNEDVLKNLKGYFKLYGVQGFCFALLPLLLIPAGMEGSLPWMMSAGFFVAAGGIFLFHIKTLPKKIVPFYCYGVCVDGVVDRSYKNTGAIAGAACWGIYYRYHFDNREYQQKLTNIPNRFWRGNYTQGDKIKVLCDPNSPDKSMPDVQNLGAFFDLKK
ncbi:MAG: hypothetical protein EA357_05990 [Micavibrio sp.]|nr:MAG: hypothetical protein EA357_05990 [Micavibrio sp.]